MFKKVNPHLYSILCAHCGARQGVDLISGIGMTAGVRQALVCRDLLDLGWSCILMERSFCPAWSEKVARGEIDV